MIKIPATDAGLEAIAEVVGRGISVNATLVFSLRRYREVLNAYLSGLEIARAQGFDLQSIHSVASVFISRFDTLVDEQLDALEQSAPVPLLSTTGVSNAWLCYQISSQVASSERAAMLHAAGANAQRPLWASTGVKDTRLPSTYYVEQLIMANTVNTMPMATLQAFEAEGTIALFNPQERCRDAELALNALDDLGISYADTVLQLEREGLQKFQTSWDALLTRVQEVQREAQA